MARQDECYGSKTYHELITRRVPCRKFRETTAMVYYATIFGNVVSVSKKTGRRKVLRARRNLSGIPQVRIWGKNVTVCEVMVRSFLVPDECPMKIYHIDGNQGNNNLKNLAVLTDVRKEMADDSNQ
jgi:hypothetical protein